MTTYYGGCVFHIDIKYALEYGSESDAWYEKKYLHTIGFDVSKISIIPINKGDYTKYILTRNL